MMQKQEHLVDDAAGDLSALSAERRWPAAWTSVNGMFGA